MELKKTRSTVRRKTKKINKAEQLSGVPAAFRSDDSLLKWAVKMFVARQRRHDGLENEAMPQKEKRQLCQKARDLSRSWHQSLRMSGESSVLGRKCQSNRLGRVDREVLVGLLLCHLGMLSNVRHQTCSGLAAGLRLSTADTLQAMRALSERGRLFKSGLLAYLDPDETLARRTPLLDPGLTDAVLSKGRSEAANRQVKNESQLLQNLERLSLRLADKSKAVKESRNGWRPNAFDRAARTVRREMNWLDETLRSHAEWSIATMLKDLNRGQRIIVLSLLGKELGHVETDHPLFTGAGLAGAASGSLDSIHSALQWLMPTGTLVKRNIIQPCGGSEELATNSPSEVERMEFELANQAVDALHLASRSLRKRNGDYAARPAQVRLDQLVLSDRVRQALNMAIVHAKHSHRILDQWGLGKMIPYGHQPVLLFSGIPGVGKTAAAESLAHALGKPILVADYSKIQNCFVGQTEKNITRVFREANKQDAVLFWDEADAMFFDRDSAHRNWEVRDINLLLQEIERFEGVCILATNRATSLDKALQRRITLKIEFDRPNQSQRRMIWRRMLPRKMPMDPDVDLDELAKEDLVGGDIKNIVLNAARLSLERDENGRVAMADFRRAIQMEISGSWNTGGRRPIGFRN